MQDQLDRIEANQLRIIEQNDQLLAALLDDEEEEGEPAQSLDGDRIPGERDTSRPL
jgi:hypothetical protein